MARLLDSLDDDEYLDAVVKETLRVRPVVVDVARKLTRPTELGGYTLPAGTLVLPAIAAVHVRPDLYPEPERVPARALHRRPARVVRLDPLRRRRAALHRRVVRAGGDAGGAARGAARVRLERPSQRPERPQVRHVTVVPARGARAVVTERWRRPAGGSRRGRPSLSPPLTRPSAARLRLPAA